VDDDERVIWAPDELEPGDRFEARTVDGDVLGGRVLAAAHLGEEGVGTWLPFASGATGRPTTVAMRHLVWVRKLRPDGTA
jgi:hypothetical protein